MPSFLIIIDLINRDEFDKKKKRHYKLHSFQKMESLNFRCQREYFFKFKKQPLTPVIVSIIEINDIVRMSFTQTIMGSCI